MGIRGGILVTVAALTLLTACTAPAPEPVAKTTSAAPTTSVSKPSSDAPPLGPGPGSQPPTTPQPPPPQSPAKVTSACPFLGVTEMSAVMGATLDTYAVEQPPDPRQGVTTYRCNYASRTGGRLVHDLFIDVLPGTGRFASLVTEWTQDCAAPAVPIPGVNGTTRTCELSKGSNSGDIMLLVAKKSHGQTRLAELDLRPFRSEVYPRLAQLLTDRL
ncbi:hypothetical protein ACIOD2_36330 [Amycolatopsis sp. NPDC088138]|uniref:hypothetical protein n=1 Tax=Amycolatopsis sp. NPDC088138 TaxID=3363938 RepID=UPI0037FEB456